mmetsp:Transcript_1195/g.2867  ORF Transcript_1195/g.2867 Transcript_1195/m.2867 type:complete len:213 (+) Transcript_1195:619-1257(+)
MLAHRQTQSATIVSLAEEKARENTCPIQCSLRRYKRVVKKTIELHHLVSKDHRRKLNHQLEKLSCTSSRGPCAVPLPDSILAVTKTYDADPVAMRCNTCAYLAQMASSSCAALRLSLPAHPRTAEAHTPWACTHLMSRCRYLCRPLLAAGQHNTGAAARTLGLLPLYMQRLPGSASHTARPHRSRSSLPPWAPTAGLLLLSPCTEPWVLPRP